MCSLGIAQGSPTSAGSLCLRGELNCDYSTVTPAVPADQAAPAGQKAKRSSPGTVALLMLLPAAVLMITFLIIPILLTLGLAFTNARLISPEPARFIGLDNFARLFQNDTFWASLRNTIVFAVVIVPIQSAVALGLALLVNVKMRGTNFFRTIYFLPVVTSIVVVSMLWLFMYQPDGLINALLAKIGIQDPTGWESQHGPVRDHRLVDLAGLRDAHGDLALRAADHPGRLYEAADLDGATKFQQFLHVTWPGSGDPHLHSDHHHHCRVLTVRPGQHHDRRRAAGRDDDPSVPPYGSASSNNRPATHPRSRWSSSSWY